MDRFSVGYNNSSFVFVDTLTSPTQDEINAFSSNAYGEIRFVEVNDVIFFLMRLGNMNWQDAPFTPHWYDPNPFYLPLPLSENHGYVFQLSLVDGETGGQVKNRIVGVGNAFSNKLHSVISDNCTKPFCLNEYKHNIEKTYENYTSDQLAEICPKDQRYIIGTTDNGVDNRDLLLPDVPSELQKWVCYPPDGGLTMCVYCVPKCLIGKSESLDDLIVPIPLKYLLDIGYKMINNGYICIDVEYDNFTGVVIPDEYLDD